MKIIIRNRNGTAKAFVVENPRIDGKVILCTLHPLCGDVFGCDSGDEAVNLKRREAPTFFSRRWFVKRHPYLSDPPFEAEVICSTCAALRTAAGDEPCVTYAGKAAKSHRTRLAPLDGYG